MASSRATVALAAVLVVGLLATVAVATDVLPSPIGPDRIEGTPEPFATTVITTGGGDGSPTATEPTATALAATTSASASADAPPPTETQLEPSMTTGTRAPIATTAPQTATATSPATATAPPASTTDATATSDHNAVPGTTIATSDATDTPGATPAERRYERARVTISAANGTRLATVRTWIADTEDKRYTGLSNTASLENGTGMLFVYDEARDLTYVMRDMNYPLDIIFVGADRRITQIAPAPAPDPGHDGEDIRRSGMGKWVLEVPRGWTNATGVEVGDRIAIERSS